MRVFVVGEKAVSQAQYENSETTAKAARSQAEAAASQVTLAETRVNDTRLVANVAGVVTAQGAEPGEVVAPGQMIVQVAREGGRDAVFDVPARAKSGTPLGTSISVGYMAENFVDFGFPGMLGGLFVIGLMYGVVIRYFMTLKVPWILREGVVLAFVMGVSHNGVEMSLPKIFGATVMFALVYTLLARFVFPQALTWLRGRAAIGQPQLS